MRRGEPLEMDDAPFNLVAEINVMVDDSKVRSFIINNLSGHSSFQCMNSWEAKGERDFNPLFKTL